MVRLLLCALLLLPVAQAHVLTINTAQKSIGLPAADIESGHSYVLHMTAIQQRSAPMFESKKSYRVYFEKDDSCLVLDGYSSLLMFQAADGQSVDHDDAKTLLARFRILDESNDAIYIRLASEGFGGELEAWYDAPDEKGRSFHGYTIQQPQILPWVSHVILSQDAQEVVVDRFVKDVKMNMRILAQVPIQERFFLKRLEGDDNHLTKKKRKRTRTDSQAFQQRKGGQFKKVGYFETHSQIKRHDGTPFGHVLKWNHQKTIVYALSHKIPDEYREAVRRGILYWNEAFGREVVEVVDAPEGIQAPHPDYNLIEWVRWDKAGFAYADVLADPLSGEIHHAQVFLTSAFAFGSLQRVRAILNTQVNADEMDEDFTPEERKNRRRLQSLKCPQSFSSNASEEDAHTNSMCQQSHKFHQFLPGLQQTLTSMPDSLANELALRVAQDYVASVVAHEVGHTMGLRHNFAAHLENKVTPKELENLYQNYLSGESVEIPELASSVMHYSNFEVSVLIGQKIQRRELLHYDQKAIEWGYDASWKECDPSVELAYCSDAQAQKFADCGPWRTFANPLADVHYDQRNDLKNLASWLVEPYIRGKAGTSETSEDQKRVQDVRIPVSKIVDRLLGPLDIALSWMTNSGWRNLQNHDDLVKLHGDPKAIEKYKKDWLKKQFRDIGGVVKSLFAIVRATGLPVEGVAPYEEDGDYQGSVDAEGSEVSIDLGSISLKSLLESSLKSDSEWKKGFDQLSDGEVDEEHGENVEKIDDVPSHEVQWPSDLKADVNKVVEKLFEDTNRDFTAADGRKVTFSQEERAFIKKNISKDLLRLAKEVVYQTLARVNEVSSYMEIEEGCDELVEAITSLSEFVLSSRSDARKNQLVGVVFISETKKPKVMLQDYIFDAKTRLEAATLLSSPLGLDSDKVGKESIFLHLDAMRRDIASQLREHVGETGLSVRRASPDKVSEPFKEWLKTNLEIIEILEDSGYSSSRAKFSFF
ncbi:MAG: zinc-dependent metalloprotease [Oligoflexales bacterium]